MPDGTVTLFDASKPKTTEGVTVTSAAAAKIRENLEAEDKAGYGLRLAVTAGGCSGHSYGLYFDEAANPEDSVYPAEGFDVFVDPQSAPLVSGTEIDFVDNLQGAGFKINNPNATGQCGCGKSFTA